MNILKEAYNNRRRCKLLKVSCSLSHHLKTNFFYSFSTCFINECVLANINELLLQLYSFIRCVTNLLPNSSRYCMVVYLKHLHFLKQYYSFSFISPSTSTDLQYPLNFFLWEFFTFCVLLHSILTTASYTRGYHFYLCNIVGIIWFEYILNCVIWYCI